MIKLSKTAKMPAKSWSLPAVTTCPASIDPATKELVDVCKTCYADKGFYNMPTVKAPRFHNMEDWKRDDWADEMITALKNQKFFRWFDSGDMYAVALANKIFEVIKRTPECRHWLPTKMYKFKKFKRILNKINSLPNVSVRFSSDSILGTKINIKGFVDSTVVPKNTVAVDGVWLCPSSKNEGKCGDCRACWSKKVQTVAYIHH